MGNTNMSTFSPPSTRIRAVKGIRVGASARGSQIPAVCDPPGGVEGPGQPEGEQDELQHLDRPVSYQGWGAARVPSEQCTDGVEHRVALGEQMEQVVRDVCRDVERDQGVPEPGEVLDGALQVPPGRDLGR